MTEEILGPPSCFAGMVPETQGDRSYLPIKFPPKALPTQAKLRGPLGDTRTKVPSEKL